MEEKLIVGGREVVVVYTSEPEFKPPLCLPFLSFGERVAAMIVCTAIGWYFQWGSLTRLLQSIRKWDPASFAISYSIGNIFSLAGSLFLVSFSEQLRRALAPERRAISLVFFGSLLLSLLCPLFFSGGVGRTVTLVAVATQIGSYWVYFFSYFPRGLDLAGRCGAGCAALVRRAVNR